MLYCLVLDETREAIERREELDAQLASAGAGGSFVTRVAHTGRDDRDRRAAQWGKTPAQQRAMRRAIDAGGAQASVAGTRRRTRGT